MNWRNKENPNGEPLEDFFNEDNYAGPEYAKILKAIFRYFWVWSVGVAFGYVWAYNAFN